MELLRFVLSSFENFVGTLVLIGAVSAGLAQVIKAAVPRRLKADAGCRGCRGACKSARNVE